MENKKRLIDANALDFRMDENGIANNIWSGGGNGDRIMKIALGCLKKMINNAPTIDAVEVVHGRWEDAHEIKSFRHTNIPVVKCSKCECYFCDIINNHHYMYHYCPNCGAKMDGEEND